LAPAVPELILKRLAPAAARWIGQPDRMAVGIVGEVGAARDRIADGQDSQHLGLQSRGHDQHRPE
jgi:hypothetical protein